MQKRKAIVFSCYYNGLSVIRELGKNGIPVIAMDTFKNIGTRSKYAEYVKCPDPVEDEIGFVDFLLEKGKEFAEKPVIIPTNDIWVFTVSKYYESLSNYYILCSSRYETVNLLLQKESFYEWAAARSFSVPRTWNFNQIDSLKHEDFPLIIKPENRRPYGGNEALFLILDNQRFQIVNTKEELELFSLKNNEIVKYFIIQEYVSGLSNNMYTVGIFSKDGMISGIFSGRKVRGYPADVGDCVVGQIEKVPDHIVDEVKRICSVLKYTGIAEFEYKKDENNGKFKLIEINPRTWSWIGITPACGVSLPLIAYQILTDSYSGPDINVSNKPDGSIKYVRIIEDLKNSCYGYKKNGYPLWHKSFFQWRRSLRCEKLVIAEYERGDIVPLLFSILNFIKRMIKKV